MRKEELDRRSAELKTRMLAQKHQPSQEAYSMATERKPATKAKRGDESLTAKAGGEDVNALRMRIAQLEAENKGLRQQLAAKSNREPAPSRSSEDSVREQRHNFFKYSNTRRY
jgi:uncharacterized membrane protein